MLGYDLTAGKTVIDLDNNILKLRMDNSYHLLHLNAVSHRECDTVKQQEHKGQLLLCISGSSIVYVLLCDLSCKYRIYIVLLTVIIKPVIILREHLAHYIVLYILADDRMVNKYSAFLIKLHHFAQIFPASGCYELIIVPVACVDLIVVIGVHMQIRNDSRVNSCIISVLHPYIKVRYAGYLLQTVPCNNIELVNRLVELRRVTCCYKYPAGRNLIKTEYLIL